jgi:dipeptidase
MLFAQLIVVLALLALISAEQTVYEDRCTAIAVGPKATADGGTMTTHTADCAECDWRVNKVEAGDHGLGASRPIYLIGGSYPRAVRSDRGFTWSEENLEDLPTLTSRWKTMTGHILGYIPQPMHTYAIIEGLYGIMNEHQVAIGESTCASKLTAAPVGLGGKALLEASELSQIALERSKTAREAILKMGELAEMYGFYSADWTPASTDDHGSDNVKGEGGEALTVIDPNEAWMFHITPDDTGESAVWVAQRVPDDHVAVVANTFTIREVDPDSPDFLYSSNLWSVAEKMGWWSKKQGKLDFRTVYAPQRLHPTYSNRRQWRVFSLVAPSLHLPMDTNPDADDYPFSVKAEYPLTPQHLMAIQRDHYEGTEISLTEGPGAGPFGDPNRFDASGTPDGKLSMDDAMQGTFERAISLFRTSYSFVAHSRNDVPDILSLVWFAQYAPDSSTYVPLYVASKQIPPAYSTGAMHMYTSKSAWWNHALIGNYAARFYKYAMKPVRELQTALEFQLKGSCTGLENAVKGMMFIPPGIPGITEDDATQAAPAPEGSLDGSVDVTIPVPDVPAIPDGKGPPQAPPVPDVPSGSIDISVPGGKSDTGDSKENGEGRVDDNTPPYDDVITHRRQLHRSLSARQLTAVVDMITQFTVDQGQLVSTSWLDLFPLVFSQYRDGYILDTTTPTIGITKMFYPKWWLEQVGYFANKPNNQDGVIYFSPQSYPVSYVSLSLIVGLFSLAVAMAGYAMGHRAGHKKALQVPEGAEEATPGTYQTMAVPKYVEIPTSSYRIQRGRAGRNTSRDYEALNRNDQQETSALNLNI